MHTRDSAFTTDKSNTIITTNYTELMEVLQNNIYYPLVHSRNIPREIV